MDLEQTVALADVAASLLRDRPDAAFRELGSVEVWNRAIQMLKDVLERRGLPYRIDEGGGAFYGPKLDFKLVDVLGRCVWPPSTSAWCCWWPGRRAAG